MIKHEPNCSPNYPEKTEGEAPQATTAVDLDDGNIALTCNDCGAFELVVKPTLLITEQLQPVPLNHQRFRIVEVTATIDGLRTRITERTFATFDEAKEFVDNPYSLTRHVTEVEKSFARTYGLTARSAEIYTGLGRRELRWFVDNTLYDFKPIGDGYKTENEAWKAALIRLPVTKC